MNEIEYKKLLHKIVSGCKFRYTSYDHKKAIEEYRTSDKYEIDREIYCNPESYHMPQALKDKYSVDRIGKLREVHFAPNGKAFRFKIGARYTKTFYIEDFGVKVFILKERSEQ